MEEGARIIQEEQILSMKDGAKCLKDHHLLDVRRVCQCYSWDCGLACVSMVLQFFGLSCSEVYTKDLDAMECGESIWTIDLAYILNEHSLQLLFYTVTLGASVEHSKKPFYQSNFGYDESRVNLLFHNAKQRGIYTEKRSLALDEMLWHVQQGRPVLVLVNQTHLLCLDCGSGHVRRCWDCLTFCQRPYVGHYVLLCGFDKTKDLVYYKDPDSNSHETCRILTGSFNRARFSDGTDEDIIVLLGYQPDSDGGGDMT